MKRFAITVAYVMAAEPARIATVVVVVKSVWDLPVVSMESSVHRVRRVIIPHTAIMVNYAVCANHVEADRVYVNITGHVLPAVLVMVVIIVLMENDGVHAQSALIGTYAPMERRKASVNCVDQISTVSTIR
jgi:hypothetical protein